MIEVERVSRAYGEVKAVRDVSFRVQAGQVVGLLGPNGAGKTTLLRMMATLLKPDAGRIRVAGFDVAQKPLEVRSRLGYETGDTGLYSRLSPVEFLRYFARLNDMPKELSEARIADLVQEMDMGEFANRLCANLSTGQKQRTSLARALLTSPPVLVLDEPTAGLDIFSSSFMLQALRRAAERDCAVLFSTHILSEVEILCDRIVILHRGRVLADGTLDEILAQTGKEHLSPAFMSLLEAADDAAGAT